MRRALLIGAIALLVSVLVFVARQPCSVRVIGYAKSSDGVELCVVQEPGDLLETSVYYREPNGTWGWFYYDHADGYWSKAEIVVDESKQRMTILRRKEPVAYFDWRTEVFRLDRTGASHRGAQFWMPPDFSPSKGRNRIRH